MSHPAGTPVSRPTSEPSRDEDRGTKKKKKKKPSTTVSSTAFVGKCEDIKEHVYDVTPGKSGFDVFAKTTREIGEYIARTIKDGGEFRTALDPEQLGFSPLAPPEDPVDENNAMQVKKWEIAYKAYNDAADRRAKATGQAFAIVLGQCSPTVIDRAKASPQWSLISNSDDLIGLLRLIRTSMYTGATSKNSMHSLIEARNKFYSFRQSSRMTNADYLRMFKGLVDAVEHLNGDLGTDHAVITERTLSSGGDPDDNNDWSIMKETIREEYLAMHFFLHADVKRYGSLVANVQNDFVTGHDKYPKDMSKAYDMLVNYVSPTKLSNSDDQDGGMSFYQDDGHQRGGPGRGNGRGGGRDTSGRGRGRGRGGSSGRASADQEHDDDNHANVEEEQEIGGTRNSSNDSQPYTDASFNICTLEQLVLMHGLPSLWLLLDSCSTADIFANADLLTNIQDAPHPIWVRCNAGRIRLTQQGYFGDYPHAVWYNPQGVANILSLHNVTKHYRVTMDSARNPAILVHKNDGTHIRFTPSTHGLFRHELTEDHSSINHMWSMLTSIPTVADNALKYTKRTYKRAVLARKLQNIIMRPSSRKYKDVIIDYLRDTPVTKADIAAADAIFGPNVGSLKGKTVRRPNEHIAAGIDPVPADVMKMHAQLTLAIDIMFINKIAFFVTKSRELQFTTIEALPNRQVKTVKDVLRTVIHLYESRGFIVGSIMADNEFEPLRAWHPTLNTTAADKHVSKIERHIRTIKDSTRSTYRMLPFRHLPRIVLIHLVKNAVFWMNAFPTNDGITRRYSPCYVMTGQHVQASNI